MIITLNYEDVRQLVAEAISRRIGVGIEVAQVVIERADGPEDVEIVVDLDLNSLRPRS